MTLPRRQFLQLAAGAATLHVTTRAARAQAYPARAARIIVGFPAGGGADIAARLMGQWLSERLGQSFVIENRPGAGGNIAAEMVVRAAPDGYTLLLVNSSNAINATLYDKLGFSLIADIAPVAGIFRGPFVMLVAPSFPARTLSEFIAYARANPGRINMASAGNGTVPHLAGELFKMMTGIDMVHVPYRGVAPALTDLLGGQVQVSFASVFSAIDFVKNGQLRALAVTSDSRWDALPDVPTVSDLLPGYEASAWFVVGAPRTTPAEIVEKLNREINAGLDDARIKARLAELGGTVLVGTPVDVRRLIADETEKWGKVVKAANIRIE
jgi:tripartite-type tricarboxylate transporter receptor subunit TctC